MFRICLLAMTLAVGAFVPSLGAQTATPRTHKVEIQQFAFLPPRIEIAVGDVVEWTNRDLAPHTATAADRSWDTGSIKNGATGRFVGTTPGTLDYFCAFHPHMKGVIVVATGAAERTSAPRQVSGSID